MSFVSKLLRTMENKVTATHFCNEAPLFCSSYDAGAGDTVEINFDKPTNINLIALYERGERVTDYSIYAKVDADFKLIYKQSRIGTFRLCAIDPVETTALKLTVDATRKPKKACFRIELFDLPATNRPFRKTAYLVLNSLDLAGETANSIGYYNHFNLIGGVLLNLDGSISFAPKEDHPFSYDDCLKRYIAHIRKNSPSASIVLTLLVSANYVKALQHPDTIKNIVSFVQEYGLDGISFDWEYPKNPYEWRVFDQFIVQLKQALQDKMLTLALASWLRYRFSKEALQSIDIAEVMTYDNMPRDIDGHHSQFYSDGADAILHFVKKGFDLKQLDLGLPFYARPVDGALHWSDYRAEVHKLDRFTNVATDTFYDNVLNNTKDKVLIKSRFFNGYQMIADKTAYCIYSGVGGVMVWHFALDVPYAHKLSLTKAINKTNSSRNKHKA